MKIFGLILMALGAYSAYWGYKKSIIKTKEGQTFQDLENDMRNSNVNKALNNGLKMGCAGYLKLVSIVGGILFFFSFKQ